MAPPRALALRSALLAALAACASAIIPHDLSNFQGQWRCASGVRMGFPSNVGDVQTLVASASLVRGTGIGHSWWSQQMCAGNSSEAINVLMTEIDNKRIVVDEQAMMAKVDAGLIIHDVLDYLASYGSGYTLPSFPWFTFQTVAGAVSTGTHGSSLSYGSLSSDDILLSLDVVLANGTLVQMSRKSHPRLWPAMQVSIGRLGIITSVTFRLVPNAQMGRYKVDITVDTFLEEMKRVQDAYNVNGVDAPEVQALDGTQFCWFFTRRRNSTAAMWRAHVSWVGDAPVLSTAFPGPLPAVGALTDSALKAALASGREPSVRAQPLLASMRGAPLSIGDLGIAFPRAFGDGSSLSMTPMFSNGTFPARMAIITESPGLYAYQTNNVQYDQYEVSIPLSRVYTCYAALADALYGPQQRWRGFRAPGLLRFVKGESGLLSPTNGGPRAYINVEDYVRYLTFSATNQDFRAAWDVLRSDTCQSRMHWGKAGWPASGFSGAAEFPSTWCDFGCAVRELDPTNKFRAVTPIWDWSANDMAACCGPDGFKHDTCTCK